MTLEEKIISYCAPTLAGMKTASLFSSKYEEEEALQIDLSYANSKLNKKGVFLEVLKRDGDFVLIYVYRKRKLENDLMQDDIKKLLYEYGYQNCRLDDCIERLKCRLSESEEFPHEIGVFLSYPFQDVLGFIKEKGKNWKICGIWKVYHDENEALKIFAKFKKCTDVYRHVFANGRTLTQLTVAA